METLATDKEPQIGVPDVGAALTFGRRQNLLVSLNAIDYVDTGKSFLFYHVEIEAVMPQGPMSPFAPGLVPFEPNAIGARLDPRRFKYAPWNAMASVPAAGKKCVRRDNLGPC